MSDRKNNKATARHYQKLARQAKAENKANQGGSWLKGCFPALIAFSATATGLIGFAVHALLG